MSSSPEGSIMPAEELLYTDGGRPMVREQRKLTAVLAADVVGYSRLMGRS